MNYARIVNNMAVDVYEDAPTRFHKDIFALFEEVPDEVSFLWWKDDEGQWHEPETPWEPASGKGLENVNVLSLIGAASEEAPEEEEAPPAEEEAPPAE